MAVTNRGVDLDFRRTGPRGFPQIDLQTIPDSPKAAEFLIPLRCGPRTRKWVGNATEFFAVFLIPRADSTWYRSDIEEIRGSRSTNESKFFRMYIPDLLQNYSIGSTGWRNFPGVIFNIASLRGTGFQVNELVWDTYPESFEIQGFRIYRTRRSSTTYASVVLGVYLFSFKVAVGISEPSIHLVLLYEYTYSNIDRLIINFRSRIYLPLCYQENQQRDIKRSGEPSDMVYG